MSQSKEATVYFDRDLDRALARKAEATHRSIFRVVNEVVRRVLPRVSKGTKGMERLMIEVKVSEIIYEDGTIWGRN